MDIVTYILSRKYVEDSLAGAGALVGKSAYDIACENGFKGTPSEWLVTLKGDSPQIGPDGNWVVAGVDTGVIASPGLAGYATEEFVNQQIANIDFPETDLSAYATREELSTAILGITIPDVSGFATKEELEDAIRAIPAPDLTSFATKEELQQAIANIPEVDLRGYATEQFVNEAIANIPQPDLKGYVTSADLAIAIAGIEHPVTDLSGLASEEFVTQKIAEAKLSEGEVDLSAYYTKTEIDNKFDTLEIPEQPDLSNFATKDEIPNVEGLASEEFVAAAIAAIEHPVVDLSGLATEEFVQNKINEIEIPEVDLTGVATEEFVREAIAEIPAPDLSGFATKDELPSVDGLASEKFVTEAIAAIEIPEAESDVKVYEISSDSVVLDELVALLPEGIEINQGDVMLVTNTLGVKSAYQYDEGWIACDGNVDASRVIMPFDITLAGSYTQVGNLSKTSTGTATFATRGKSVAAALQEMLSKREQPSIKTQPKVTLTATSGAKEVGTEITPTWSASLGAGEYTYGPATGVVAKTWTISDTDGHSASTASGSFAKFTVGDNTNYRITAKATYDEGVIAKDNLGDPSNPVVRIAAGSKTTNGSYVTGYRAWFMYVGESLDTIDSAFIRGTTNKGATPSTQSGVTIPAGTKRVMVAIPANGSNLTSVIDVDGMGLDVFGNFTKMNVDVEGLNGYKATSYDVWVAENENGMAATHYNLVIG